MARRQNNNLPQKLSPIQSLDQKQVFSPYLNSYKKKINEPKNNSLVVAKRTCESKKLNIVDMDENGNPSQGSDYFATVDELTGKPFLLRLIAAA